MDLFCNMVLAFSVFVPLRFPGAENVLFFIGAQKHSERWPADGSDAGIWLGVGIVAVVSDM
jgi:hypothetical protein